MTSSATEIPVNTEVATVATIITSEPPTAKGTTLHSGWLQINKLYTPFVSNTPEKRHLYRIPINLLTFYRLLRPGSNENGTSEPRDSLSFIPSEKNLATLEELEVINRLCNQQNIKPFTEGTSLIDLATFYQYCSANRLFIKELPMTDPKASICKTWTTVTKTNGGLCRLRNIATLCEKTIPVIGDSLLNDLVLSPQTLATASITTPSETDIEFLRLMLFFIDQPFQLTHAQLINIEAVKIEYTVDIILVFNDKFPIHVLNYQRQGKSDSDSALFPRRTPFDFVDNRTHPQPASVMRTNSSTNNTV